MFAFADKNEMVVIMPRVDAILWQSDGLTLLRSQA